MRENHATGSEQAVHDTQQTKARSRRRHHHLSSARDEDSPERSSQDKPSERHGSTEHHGGRRTICGTLADGGKAYVVKTGSDGYGDGDDDALVPRSLAERNGMRPGDWIVAVAGGRQRERDRYQGTSGIISVNGLPMSSPSTRESLVSHPRFGSLTPIYPDRQLILGRDSDDDSGRMVDLVAPIGLGQRGLVVSPPKAGKTTMLKHICQSASASEMGLHVMCLLIDERPEEVTDMRRSVDGEVIASTFDMCPSHHVQVAEQCLERARRLVEGGDDVIIVMDSITRLARAYNLSQPASGHILSGGVDASALYPPKRFFGAARNIDGGGSLTIIASALVDTGSKMDELIFEEYKGTGNQELRLSRALAERGMFPAIDVRSSGTRNEEHMFPARELDVMWSLRRQLVGMSGTGRDDAAVRQWRSLANGIHGTHDNSELLVRFAERSAACTPDL